MLQMVYRTTRNKKDVLYFPSFSPAVPTADPLPAIVEFDTTPNPPGPFGRVVCAVTAAAAASTLVARPMKERIAITLRAEYAVNHFSTTVYTMQEKSDKAAREGEA